MSTNFLNLLDAFLTVCITARWRAHVASSRRRVHRVRRTGYNRFHVDYR